MIIQFICFQVVDSGIYQNTIIIGVVGVIGYLIAGSLVNALSPRILICEFRGIQDQNSNLIKNLCSTVIFSILATILGSLIHKASTSFALTSMLSVYMSLGGIISMALIGLTTTLVPTQLR